MLQLLLLCPREHEAHAAAVKKRQLACFEQHPQPERVAVEGHRTRYILDGDRDLKNPVDSELARIVRHEFPPRKSKLCGERRLCYATPARAEAVTIRYAPQ